MVKPKISSIITERIFESRIQMIVKAFITFSVSQILDEPAEPDSYICTGTSGGGDAAMQLQADSLCHPTIFLNQSHTRRLAMKCRRPAWGR